MSTAKVFRIETEHNVGPHGACNRCGLYLGADVTKGRKRIPSSPMALVDAYNRLHSYEDKCPVRVVDEFGKVYTKETLPKPEIGIVNTPNPDRVRDLPGVGYWKGAYSPSYPDPRDFVDTAKTPEEREDLAAYLDAGRVMASFRGCSECRFCKKIVGSRALSDDRFVWPEGLSHYVREHGVWIPDVLPTK